MPSINVLLVDDQLSSLVVLETILETLDATLIKTGSARQALRAMLECKVDCILLDVSMPEMDGFEFLQTLKEAPAHASIPVIMVTGKVFSENETLRAYQYGAVDFLIKPLDSEMVFRKVSFFVQQARRIRCLDAIDQQLQQLEEDMIEPLERLKDSLGKKTSAKDLLDGVTGKLRGLKDDWLTLKNVKSIEDL